MKKFYSACLLMFFSTLGFSQANTFVSNDITSMTFDQPCLNVPSGTYTVKLRYFDLRIGNWTTPT